MERLLKCEISKGAKIVAQGSTMEIAGMTLLLIQKLEENMGILDRHIFRAALRVGLNDSDSPLNKKTEVNSL